MLTELNFSRKITRTNTEETVVLSEKLLKLKLKQSTNNLQLFLSNNQNSRLHYMLLFDYEYLYLNHYL
jgi:hypothetical protein